MRDSDRPNKTNPGTVRSFGNHTYVITTIDKQAMDRDNPTVVT